MFFIFLIKYEQFQFGEAAPEADVETSLAARQVGGALLPY